MATILETLTIASREFEKAGVDSPRLTAELLLAHALGCKRFDLYLKFDQPLQLGERLKFGAMYKRRIAREPLQYIIGEQEFCGLTIAVTDSVLIPRPETEELVEEVVRRAALLPIPNALRIVDIGTGSGCIGLALAKRIEGSVVVGLDISGDAIATAQRNAESNGIENMVFSIGDILTDTCLIGMFEIIVSNPPYIPLEEWNTLQPEVRDHEPRQATTDGADGVTFYRRIAAIAPQHLAPNGFVAVEMGFEQANTVRKIFEANGFNVDTVKDMSGIERMLFATCAP
jgi:release factor glutamine methyltransferase